MLRENIYKMIKETYKKDVMYDMLLKNDYHITFVIDLLKKPFMIQIITGNLHELGLPNQSSFTFEEFHNFIEPDNALAEVEGKMTFIQDLKKKILDIDQDKHIYVPIQSEKGIIWLFVSLQVITKKESHVELVFGRVNRITYDTPEEIIYYQKTHQDPLTKLFTRETLKKHMTYLINYESSYGLYIDIDGFKSVNDVYGHECGDAFLKRIANHFIDNWEANVIYYRLGGDEFFMYVTKHTEQEVIKRAQKVIHDIENLSLDGKEIEVSASVGIVPINAYTKDYQTLLDLGDKAMYESKAKGRGKFTISKGI